MAPLQPFLLLSFFVLFCVIHFPCVRCVVSSHSLSLCSCVFCFTFTVCILMFCSSDQSQLCSPPVCYLFITLLCVYMVCVSLLSLLDCLHLFLHVTFVFSPSVYPVFPGFSFLASGLHSQVMCYA